VGLVLIFNPVRRLFSSPDPLKKKRENGASILSACMVLEPSQAGAIWIVLREKVAFS
jgi:hypothetical protein